ncbi:MAG: NosD domain-containing protein, partial [Endomicrobiaceae bacterium]|nr:NosD domain-containing protein [Endomicrobiaceae bacterium]
MKLNKNITLKSGLIKKNEKWSGNILIGASVTVLEGVQVVVEPGTIIKFANKDVSVNNERDQKLDFLFSKFNIEREQYTGNPSIIVYGSFFVVGKKDNNIHIGNCSWNGHIFIAKNGWCKFKYVEIKYSFGLIFDFNAKNSKIESCLFEQCFFGIVNFSKIIVKQSVFRFNVYGILAYERCITFNNALYENLKHGIIIESASKSYIVSNYLFLNNNAIGCKQSLKILTKDNILYGNSLGISILNSSDIRIANDIFLNNNIGLKVAGNSADVYIGNCLYSNSQIYILDESCVEVYESLVIICNVAITCSERTNVFISKSNFFDNKVNFMLFDNSCVEVLDSKSYTFNINVILCGQSFLSVDKSIFDSKNCLYVCCNNSFLNICDSEIKGQDFLYSDFFSEILLKNNFIDVHNFIKMFDCSNVYLYKNNIHIYNDGIISNDCNYIFVEKTNISIDIGAFLDLKNDEIIYINDSNIKGLFCKSFYNCNLRIKNSSIENKYNYIEIFNNVCVKFENTKIEGDILVNGTSNIEVKNSNVGSISVAGFSILNIEKSYVKGNILNISDIGELNFKNSVITGNIIN